MRGLLYIIALSGPVIALIFGTHALWSWIAANWGNSIASLVTGGAFLLLASIAAIVVLATKKEEPAPVEEAVTSGGKGILSLAEAAITRRPFETVSVMVGIGALLARNPGFALMLARRFL